MADAVIRQVDQSHLPALGALAGNVEHAYLCTVQRVGIVEGTQLQAALHGRRHIQDARQLHALVHTCRDVADTTQLQSVELLSRCIGEARQLHAVTTVSSH